MPTGNWWLLLDGRLSNRLMPWPTGTGIVAGAVGLKDILWLLCRSAAACFSDRSRLGSLRAALNGELHLIPADCKEDRHSQQCYKSM